MAVKTSNYKALELNVFLVNYFLAIIQILIYI